MSEAGALTGSGVRPSPRAVGARQALAAVLAAVLLAGTVLVSGAPPAGASSGQTWLTLDSDPGDFVGGGIQQRFQSSDGAFWASRRDGEITVYFQGASVSWTLDFEAPRGSALIPGPYEEAAEHPFQSPTKPGLRVNGAGRACKWSTGRFDVLEVVYAVDGSIRRFAADFEQHCEGQPPALRGSIRYHASSTFPPPPDDDRDGLPNTVDNCPRAANRGQEDADRDGMGDACDSTFNHTWLHIDSEPGDFIGQGRSYTLYAVDGAFTSERQRGVVRLWFDGGSPYQWNLEFAAPGGAELVPGPYEGATRSISQSPAKPGMDVSQVPRGCNQLTGRFDVLEAVYAVDGSLRRFAADFEQHCEGGEPALRGSVRYDASATTFPPPPDDDGDGVPNTVDNCPRATNADQADADRDGTGDACDPTYNHTWLRFDSDAGDSIGKGVDHAWYPADGPFEVSRDGGSVQVSFKGGPTYWELRFAAPDGGELVAGAYDGASRYGQQPPGRPGLEVFGSGRRCSTITGRFDVVEAVYAVDGSLHRFAADFQQHCEGGDAALRGSIRYDASQAFAPPTPTIDSVEGHRRGPAVGDDATPAIVVSGVAAGDTVVIRDGTTPLASKVVPPGASTVTFNAAETDSEVTVAGIGDHSLTAVATGPTGSKTLPSHPFVYRLTSFDGTFHALSPARILDTRTGDGTTGASKVGPGRTVGLQVTGRGGVPSSGVSAVVMNVTVTQPSASSYLTAWPAGTTRPTASNLNYVAGQTVPNLVTVKVGTGGRVNLYNAFGSTHVVADVVGWYSDGSTAGARYQALSPARILDTRTGTGAPTAPVGPGRTLGLQVAGKGGLPISGVSAVVMNVTVTEPSASSYLTAWPAGTTRPTASNLNYVAGQTVPNLVVVKVGDDGRVNLYNASGSTHVVADVVGWYSDGSTAGARYQALSPARILDTRTGTGAPAAKVGPNQAVALQVTGKGGVPPSGVSAVVMNVTVTQPSASSYLTAWRAGASRPTASNLNYVAGQTVPNLVVVKVGTGGQVNLYNAFGSTHVVADVVGWYSFR
jgi:hypothetical protein